MKDEKGFTLIELMIVILIIGIIVAIAIPVYAASRDNARKRTCQANMRTMDGALQYFASENDGFPNLVDNPNTQWSRTISISGTIVDDDEDSTDLVPTYIKKPPICQSGGIYTYNPPQAGVTAYVSCDYVEHDI